MNKPTYTTPEIKNGPEDGSDPDVALSAQLQLQQVTISRGPLPPPEVMTAYEQLHPGSVKRFFDAWDQQREHRLKLEAESARGEAKRKTTGQWLAFGVSIAGIILSFLLALALLFIPEQQVDQGAVAAIAIAILVFSVGGPTAATMFAANIASRYNVFQKTRGSSSQDAP